MAVMNGNEAAAIELTAMKSAWRDLVIDWGLTWGERRSLLPHGGDELMAPPADTETRMRIMIEIGHRLRFDTPGELDDWLREPSELWKWHSPIEVMSGTLPDLRRFRQFVEMGLCS